ncbi:MAG: hypothetical protein NT015_01415 [Alphaproteobacteria bacterium]|nr:hypothetical protein [Alphaproteobacteria bacterium]
MEVRLRQQDLMSGTVRAYAVRPGAVTVYRHDRHENSARTVVVNTRRIFAAAADLTDDNERSFSCNVVDGDVVDVAMIVEGRLISVGASNPSLCQYQDAGSRRVQRLYESIEQALDQDR